MFFFVFYFTVRDRLELESRFKECVRAAVEYVSIIDDFDDLVDPRTLACYCLGLEPSHYILYAFAAKKKVSFFRTKIDRLSFPFFSPFPFLFLALFLTSLLFLFSFAEMTTKFNQEFYARIKAKKNEPLSSISQRRLRVVEKEKEKEVTEKGFIHPCLEQGLGCFSGPVC